MARCAERYRDRYWWSHDGLWLHYRDYPGGRSEWPPRLCRARVELAELGHAPLLIESELAEPIAGWLERVAEPAHA